MVSSPVAAARVANATDKQLWPLTDFRPAPAPPAAPAGQEGGMAGGGSSSHQAWGGSHTSGTGAGGSTPRAPLTGDWRPSPEASTVAVTPRERDREQSSLAPGQAAGGQAMLGSPHPALVSPWALQAEAEERAQHQGYSQPQPQPPAQPQGQHAAPRQGSRDQRVLQRMASTAEGATEGATGSADPAPAEDEGGAVQLGSASGSLTEMTDMQKRAVMEVLREQLSGDTPPDMLSFLITKLTDDLRTEEEMAGGAGAGGPTTPRNFGSQGGMFGRAADVPTVPMVPDFLGSSIAQGLGGEEGAGTAEGGDPHADGPHPPRFQHSLSLDVWQEHGEKAQQGAAGAAAPPAAGETVAPAAGEAAAQIAPGEALVAATPDAAGAEALPAQGAPQGENRQAEAPSAAPAADASGAATAADIPPAETPGIEGEPAAVAGRETAAGGDAGDERAKDEKAPVVAPAVVVAQDGPLAAEAEAVAAEEAAEKTDSAADAAPSLGDKAVAAA